MAKYLRTVEKTSGRGQITLAGGQALTVHYALVVKQAVDDAVDTGQLVGQAEITGTIVLDRDQGLVDLASIRFTLKTNDNRCVEAWGAKGDPVTRVWEIATSARGQGLRPC